MAQILRNLYPRWGRGLLFLLVLLVTIGRWTALYLFQTDEILTTQFSIQRSIQFPRREGKEKLKSDAPISWR